MASRAKKTPSKILTPADQYFEQFSVGAAVKVLDADWVGTTEHAILLRKGWVLREDMQSMGRIYEVFVDEQLQKCIADSNPNTDDVADAVLSSLKFLEDLHGSIAVEWDR